MELKVGDRVYFYKGVFDKSYRVLPSLKVKSYDRIIGRIVRILQPEQRLSASDISNWCGIQPTDSNFNDLYKRGLDTKWLKALMVDNSGNYYLHYEFLWKKNSHGDPGYIEKIPNSLDFIIGD